MEREDRLKILKEYILVIKFLSKVAGKNCEILLIDIDNDLGEILYIINGNLSGKKKGDKLNKNQLEKIMKDEYNSNDYTTNHIVINENNQKVFRESTYYIKSEEGELIGLMSINRDLTKYLEFREFYDKELLYGFEKNEEQIDKFFNLSLDSILEDMIRNVFIYWDRSIPVNKIEEEGNPIRELYQKDVFKYKGAVNKVADLLDISTQTIYRYIKELEEE
ncbi:helix-turn-helix transcriptional regulator [Peptoniphilus stercorisuis]|uniref:Transcriptional regulator YheO n=1 Tax=Peptoniphilus stercorisuis TaxID=1436965 RepID=A0ABS4KA90_9FIRM|nr:PAS domain-containing protein [Peptoniphilus stercorisuis]MBP2024695.1 putative transcriptional regulator YheO [Peptoniphilus stercorisuis]